MKPGTLDYRHICLISIYWIRYVIQGGPGLVFIMVASIFSFTVAQTVLTPVEMLMDQHAEKGSEINRDQCVTAIIKLVRPIIRWALDINDESPPITFTVMERPIAPELATTHKQLAIQRDPCPDPWTTFLIYQRPALLSVIFLVLIFGMPLLIPFLAFNQTSGDIQNKNLRYLLLRTTRLNIFLGRFVGTAIFSMLVIGTIVAAITWYINIKIPIYPLSSLVSWALYGYVILAILVFPYISVCSWISAVVDSPLLSLVLAQLIIGGIPLFAFIAHFIWKPATNIKFLLPWGLQNHLLHPELIHSVGTMASCLLYTIALLSLGYRHFENRDL